MWPILIVAPPPAAITSARRQQGRRAGGAGFEEREAERGGAGDAERAGAAEEFFAIDGVWAMIVHGAPYRVEGWLTETFLRRQRAPCRFVRRRTDPCESLDEEALAWRRNGPNPRSSCSCGCSARSTRGASRSRSSRTRSARRSRPARGRCGATLSVLSDAGFPWYFDRASGTYRFAEGYSLRRLNLSHRELLGPGHAQAAGLVAGRHVRERIEETTQKLLRSSDRRAEAAVESTSFAIRFESVALDARGRARLRAAADRRARAAPRAVRLHRQERRPHPAPGRPLRLHRLERAHLPGRLRSRPHRHARLRGRQRLRGRDHAADVRAPGRLQPRRLRRELGQRRAPRRDRPPR